MKPEKSVKMIEEPSDGKKVIDGFIALCVLCFKGLMWLGQKFLDLCVWVANLAAKKMKK